MPRTSKHLLAALLASASAFAQHPAQPLAQQPGPAPAQTPAAPPTSIPRAPTIQARTNLVVVDVVVTDHAGKSFHGLQQADFALTEKGVPQQIRSFEEHAAPAQPPVPETMPVLPPGVFTNYTPAPQTAALNVLLLDTLNTPLTDQAYVRQQILKYIRTAPPGNRIAIFGLTSRLIYLQGFTSDPDLLKLAVDKKSMRPSDVLDNPVSSGSSEQLSDTATSIEASSHGGIGDVATRMKQFEAETATFQIDLRIRYTLEAMNTLARYLSGLPGRKNLIWFSGAFPINVLPNGDIADPFSAMADLSSEFRDTATLLTKSQVAVYPVDARGLFNVPMNDASERGSASPQAFSQQLMKFNQRTAEEHITMRDMAEQTGGRAFVNTNGLKEAVDTVISTGANFYTLAYSPKDTNWNNAYRKIGLKLTGRLADANLSMAYRRGYFAVDPNPPAPARKALTSDGNAIPVPVSAAAMRAAMMRGAPDPTQIIFKARILPAFPASSPPEDKPDPDTRLNPDPKLAHGPWRRYLIDLAAVPSQLLVTRAPNGDLSGFAEFVVHCYDSDGSLIAATSTAVRMNLTTENARQFAHTGVPIHQVISVPDRGQYFLRIGVHDLVGDHVGALEVAVASIKISLHYLHPPHPHPRPLQPIRSALAYP